MADLTEKLSVLDKMSDSIMKIVQAGKSMAEQFERTGNTVGTAFGYICGTAADSVGTLAGILSDCGNTVEFA